MYSINLCIIFSKRSPWAVSRRSSALKSAFALAKLTGCGSSNASKRNISDQVTCLRQKEASVLTSLQWEDSVTGGDSAGYLPIPFAPVTDGSFIPYRLKKLQLHSIRQNKPVLIGFNRNEGMNDMLDTLTMYENLSKTPDDFTIQDMKVTPEY